MRRDTNHLADERPNILLIMSDEHDPAVTGCYGHPHVQTPNLDRLAEEGVTFDSAYCNSPMCVPSRASFLTGRYAHQIRVWDNSGRIRGEYPTFGSYLEAAGYDTVICGRTHLMGEDRLHGFGRRIHDDMDSWISTDQRARRTPDARRGSASHVTESGPGTGSWQQYDETVASLAELFLTSRARHPSDRPWLLACGFMFPHFPLIAPRDLFDRYWPDRVVMPDLAGETLATQHPVIQHLRYFMHNDEDLDEEVTRRALASYYALVTLVDMHVGRLVRAIDTSPLRDNTVIIYTSDHGEMAGAHGMWQKQCFYEPAVRVPLIVRTPDGPRSLRIHENVSLVDILPTLLEVASVPVPSGLPGSSLWGAVQGGEVTRRDVFSEYHAQGVLDGAFMLKRDEWKYIYYAGGHPPQLFNVRDDPGELRDLGQDPAYSAMRMALHRALLEICDPELVDAEAKRDQLAAADRSM